MHLSEYYLVWRMGTGILFFHSRFGKVLQGLEGPFHHEFPNNYFEVNYFSFFKMFVSVSWKIVTFLLVIPGHQPISFVPRQVIWYKLWNISIHFICHFLITYFRTIVFYNKLCSQTST